LPRIDKCGQRIGFEAPRDGSEGDNEVRYIGIDVGKEQHAIAVMDDSGEVVLKPKKFAEDIDGYERLRRWVGEPEEALIGLEATGHYWKNLATTLLGWGFALVLINPLRTKRFAESDLARAKTDAIDAKRIARFLFEKRPDASRLRAEVSDELRELVRLRDRLLQDMGDRVRQLHRAVDLGFPEFSRMIKNLGSQKATAVLAVYPTAKAFAAASERELSNLRYDGRHTVGRELARALIETAKVSVGQHHGEPYQLQVGYFCEDIDTLRERLKKMERRIRNAADQHDLAKLLTSIDGIGPSTAARLIATLGDPSDFDSAKALSAFVGVAPIIQHSGKSTPKRASCGPHGAAKLRHKLYMPTLRAIQSNPHIKRHYDALVARGKPKKLAVIACMRRLLELVFVVAKRRTPFLPVPPQMA
tara:strand:+ start:264 stop:1514 length:1251 start_codon:yes stop_codon:yes gene_type:complete